MIDPLLKSYTSDLAVLCVEDDPVGAAIIHKMLEPLFGHVYSASNGAEGVREFHQQQPDLIVSDLMMPVMDGISMLREIRKSNQKTPVLLMTASLEHVHLVEAINLGVSKFLAKPLRVDALQRALFAVTRELYLERVAEQARQQEVELLQYRNRYHSLQQELAQAKERHIVNNLFETQYLQHADHGGWLVDLLQQPRDIMSGDSYSVVRTNDNTLLLFLADAMGHGLSASVTSMLATAFFNYAVQGYSSGELEFAALATSVMNFAAQNLLEDEVFSGLVLELDPQRKSVQLASCGMPALLLARNGRVERIRGANPPVSAFLPPLQLQRINLDGVSDILLATDGLGDAGTREGGAYRERLSTDLLTTATTRELFAQYSCQSDDSQNDDDITIVRLIAVATEGQRYCFTAPPTLAGLSYLQTQASQQLEAAGAAGERLDNLELALSEALLNAFEHGFLRMGADKPRLMQDDAYDGLVMAAAPEQGVEISLELILVPRMGRLQVWLEVADPGSGFEVPNRCDRHDRKSAATATAGRGFMIMQRSVDLVRYNPAGNRLLLMQMFDVETTQN